MNSLWSVGEVGEGLHTSVTSFSNLTSSRGNNSANLLAKICR